MLFVLVSNHKAFIYKKDIKNAGTPRLYFIQFQAVLEQLKKRCEAK